MEFIEYCTGRERMFVSVSATYDRGAPWKLSSLPLHSIMSIILTARGKIKVWNSMYSFYWMCIAFIPS